MVNGLTDEYEKAIKWYLMHEVPQIGSACISSNKDDLTRDKEHGADYTCLDIAPPTGNGDGEDKEREGQAAEEVLEGAMIELEEMSNEAWGP